MATVNNYAFYGCTALERVNFAGEETDWAAVNIGTNNTPLTDAEVVFE